MSDRRNARERSGTVTKSQLGRLLGIWNLRQVPTSISTLASGATAGISVNLLDGINIRQCNFRVLEIRESMNLHLAIGESGTPPASEAGELEGSNPSS